MIGTRPLGKLTADQQEIVLTKRRLVHNERARVELAAQLAAERRAAGLQQAALTKSEQAVRAAMSSWQHCLSHALVMC